MLPLDGTPVSEAAAPQAVELAKWLDAELMVVGVIEPAAHAEAGAVPGDVMESSYVHSMADRYAAQHGVRVSWDVLYGEPAEAIADFIKGRKDVILAMATHGRKGLEAALLGSVTAGCLRKSGVPVLVSMP
ncbi:MAG: universal stress protein [Gemmatimonadales bacterium]|nr:universal stress protein [Gemmatimonadales bacterium]